MKRVLSLVLALIMVVSGMAFAVSADEAADALLLLGSANGAEVVEDVYSFVVYESSEKDFLVRTSAGANDAQRFSDGGGETVYKFTLTNTDDVQYIKWYIRTWGRLLLQVTTEDASESSNVNWTTVVDTQGEIIDTLDRVYDFTDALVQDGKAPEVFYARIANSDSSQGCGGSIFTGVSSDLVVGRTPTAEEAATMDPDVLAGKVIENHTFSVFGEDEKAYLIKDTAGSNGSQRFCDTEAELIYKYTISNYKTVSQILWTATTSGELRLSITTGDASDESAEIEWVDVYNDTTCLDAAKREYDLTTYLVDENGVAAKTFYLRLADSVTETGNGGSVWAAGSETTLRVVSDYKIRDYTFRVDEKSEEKYLMEYGNSNVAAGYCRFNDTTNETVYKFEVYQSYGVQSITWTASLGGQLDLQFTTDDASKASSDGDNIVWESLYNTTESADLGFLTFDLTDKLVNEDGSLKCTTFYIRIADADITDGNGGRIIMNSDATLTVIGERVQPVVIEEEKEESTFTDAQLKYTVHVNEGGNYCFTTINHPNYEIKVGDYLVYEVKMDATSIAAGMGYIDMNFSDGSNLRDNGLTDRAGDQVHPNATLSAAKDNMWITRIIDLSSLEGKTIADFQVSTHPAGRTAAGDYTALYDNIIIYNAAGVAKCTIYVDETYIDMNDVVDSPASGITGTIENIECMEYEHEYAVFTPLDDTDPGTEKAYLLETNAGNNGTCRFSDQTLYTIYKFDVSNTLSVQKVTFTATMGAQMVFSVSMDNKNWVELYRSGLNSDGVTAYWKVMEHTVNLTNGIDFSESKTIYIKIEDATTEDGNGGQITKETDAMLDVWYVKLSDEELDAYEAKATAHKIPLFGCNTAFGGWTLDKEIKASGSASLTKSVGTGSADSVSFDPVNATGMDTFEFDIWVSDTSFFDKFAGAGMNSGFEVTSSGACDKQEISWNLASIVSSNQGDAIVANSWCHIILPISTAARNDTDGEFNIAAANFVRFFFVGEAADTGITVKLDNLVFTDYEAQLNAAAEAEAAPAIEQLNALKDATITDDNYKSMKSEISKARRAYDKLSDLAKTKVSAEVLKYLTDAEAAKEAYDASKETPTPTEEPTPSVTAEPTGEDVTTAPTAEPTTAPTSDGGIPTVVIIIIVVVVVLAVAACLYFFVFKKKK